MLQILYADIDCNDEGLLKIIYLIKTGLNLVKIFVPIMLIIWCMWDAIRNVISQNGWDQKIIKKLLNRFLAAVCVFLIPSILNFVLGILGENGFEVGTCWQEATDEKIRSIEKTDVAFSEQIETVAEKIKDLRKELTDKWGKNK